MTWHVVYTKPGDEFGVRARLESSGVEAFLPQYQKEVRHAGKTHLIPAALFPRYLFARQGDAFPKVFSTVGVSRVLCDAEGRPRPVANEVIKPFQDTCFVPRPLPVLRKRWEKNQLVRMKAGLFIGYNGLFQSNDEGRVNILLAILGGWRKITVSEEDIEGG